MASWLVAGSAVAAVRGIVVGINQYPKIPNGNLDGAVNDASDIADALHRSGAQDVVTLLDQKATRAAVVDAWRHMLKRSKVGDTLLFSFAGHGIQLPERVRGTELDGMDEALVLTGFKMSPQNGELLLDDDLAAFLKQASDSGIKVLFLADACHSGTMTRGIDTRVRKFKFRALPPLHRGLADTVSDGPAVTPENVAAAGIKVEDLPGINYVGAVQDHQLAPETLIDGNSRGALSWAAAKAIRGDGDLDHNGTITDKEFISYVRDTVVTRMEGQQQPSMPQKSGEPLAMFADPVKRPDDAKVDTATAALLPLPIAIKNAKLPAEQLIQQVKNARLVSDGSAVLTWDAQRGEILGTLGDVVANVHAPTTRAFARRSTATHLNGQATPEPCMDPSPTRAFVRRQVPTITSTATPAAKPKVSNNCESSEDDLKNELPLVQRVVDKWTLVEMLRPYVERQPMSVTLDPEDRIFKDKDPVSLILSGQRHPYFTLFNLASDGTVNFLYPLKTEGYNDPLQIPPGQPYRLDLSVQPPFGEDHFVGLASDVPLEKLHATLARLNGTQDVAELLEILKTQLATQDVQVGMRGVYTGKNQ